MTAVAAVTLAAGVMLTFTAALGLLRLPDVYARMHPATKATSLGLASLLAGTAVLLPSPDVVLKMAVAVFFQFVTAPVASHVLGRAVQHHLAFEVHVDELRDDLDHDLDQRGRRPDR